MFELPENDKWLRRCSDSRLSELAADVDDFEPRLADSVRAEMERRRSDPNSTHFRPTFF